MADLQQAISNNLAQLMGSSQQLPATAQPSALNIAATTLPQTSTLVLNTQDEIVRELEQRLRKLSEQLEDIRLDVQMATVDYGAAERPSSMPRCLLDCQQVASRTDRLGKQLDELRRDLDSKHMARFYDQLVSSELYGKLDSLRQRQQEVIGNLEELTPHLNLNPAMPIVSQLFELENCRVQAQSDFNSAQAELEEATTAERETLRSELNQKSAELFSTLRQFHRGQLATLGSRFAVQGASYDDQINALVAKAKQIQANLAPTLNKISSQSQQLATLAEKLKKSITSKFPSASGLKNTLSSDLAQLNAGASLTKELAAFELDSTSSVQAFGAAIQKLNALMSSLWQPASDPLTRWCEGMKRLQDSKVKLSPDNAAWLTETLGLLCPMIQSCNQQVLDAYGQVEENNMQVENLKQEISSCIHGSECQSRETDNQRFKLNAAYEADKHQLAIKARSSADARIHKLEQQQQECKAKNRAMLDSRIEQLKKNISALFYNLSDSTALSNAKELGDQFIREFNQLQATNDQILHSEAELAQLRRAKDKALKLKRMLAELRDSYARTQDVVSVIRPKPLLDTSSNQEKSFIFNLKVEIDGVQSKDQADIGPDSAMLELSAGPTKRAVTVPIDEASPDPVATLNFNRVTQAAIFKVKITADGKVLGQYEMPLEIVDEFGEWLEYPIDEESGGASSDNKLEPVMRFKLIKQ